jgi:hypothetical protein
MDGAIMIAGKHNFVADFGQTFVTVVTVTDDAGDPIDWTGWHGNFSLAAPAETDIEQVEAVVTANDEGEITITIGADDWIQPGTFKYDLLMHLGSDHQYIIFGDFKVRDTVGRHDD